MSDLGAHPAAQESHESKPDLRDPSLSCIHTIRWRVNFDQNKVRERLQFTLHQPKGIMFATAMERGPKPTIVRSCQFSPSF